MKFYCNGTDLANATNIVSKALAVNKNIPILEGIKINAHGREITLSAYNQEIYIEKTISAEIKLEGELVVKGKIFTDFANKISNVDRIEIEKGLNNKINFTFGKSTSEINYYEINNFPDIGDFNEDINIKLKEKELKELLDRAIFCVSQNDNRILLKSCSIEVKGDEVEAVCLDGFRVGISKKKPDSKNGKFKAIIIGKTIQDIIKILGDGEDIVTVSKFNNMVIFDLGHTKIKTTTIEGDFYKYENNMPKTINTTVVINREELEVCLNRAGIISREHFYNNVVLNFGENNLNILAESEKGKVNENIDCKVEGEPVKIGINNKYIYEAVSKIKEDYVKIEIENNVRPIMVRKTDGDDFRCIILPVRIV